MAGDKIISPDFFVFTRIEDSNSNLYSNYQGVFKSCWDHLKYLETLGVTTEIARNDGNAVDGRGPGTGWWDEPDRFGTNGWSCFRWNSNSNRSWEWYMLIQNCDETGPAAPGDPGYSVPGTGNTRGFHLATAISISGSTTENPWGGTTGSLGSDTKGSPVWVTSSVDYKLFVFPDANGVSGVLSDGTVSTDREGMVLIQPLFRIIKDVGGNEFRYATTNSGSSGLRRAFLPADTNSEGENSYSVFWSGSFLPGTGSIAVSASISGAVRF